MTSEATLPVFYHCAPLRLGAGSIIEPGNWGRLVRLHDWNNPAFVQKDFAEAALEFARLALRPDAPSRLNCVFCLEDEISCRSYLQRHAKQSVMHQVQPVEREGQAPALFRTKYSLIGAVQPVAGISPLQALEENIRHYWQGNPDTDVEVLVGGPVRVLKSF